MASEFDRLMQQADAQYFRVFGEDQQGSHPTYTAPGGFSGPVMVDVSLGRNVEVAGAEGSFRTVQLLAELRVCQVARPQRGGRLRLAEGDFLLAEPIDSDGLVNRWSLLPAG
jgi:hypothetical protein